MDGLTLPMTLNIPVFDLQNQTNINCRTNIIELHPDYIVQEIDLFADEPDSSEDPAEEWKLTGEGKRTRSYVRTAVKRSSLIGVDIVYLKASNLWKVNVIAEASSQYVYFLTKKEAEEIFKIIFNYIFNP